MAQAYQLAELNIARARYEHDDPRFAGFVTMIEPVNQSAERMPGYVWRLVDEGGSGAMDIQAFDDPRLLVNLSVWEDLESLQNFIHKTIHAKLMAQREAWFDAMESHHMALWWVPAGHRPDLAEAKDKLAALDAHGPGPDVFTFSAPFTPDGKPA